MKCSHGATVGQIDVDALFYMRSRGIGERDAKLMLMFGFYEIVGQISIPTLRDRLDEIWWISAFTASYRDATFINALLLGLRMLWQIL